MKVETDDLKMTRELCRKPGVLKPRLQNAYSVVRGGVEVRIQRGDLSPAESVVIIEELRRKGTSVIAGS